MKSNRSIKNRIVAAILCCVMAAALPVGFTACGQIRNLIDSSAEIEKVPEGVTRYTFDRDGLSQYGAEICLYQVDYTEAYTICYFEIENNCGATLHLKPENFYAYCGGVYYNPVETPDAPYNTDFYNIATGTVVQGAVAFPVTAAEEFKVTVGAITCDDPTITFDRFFTYTLNPR